MNAIFTHPGQPEMQVEVILASKGPTEHHKPVYTLRLRYPRITHGEIMTHRVFSRNARSSRAVPVKTMLEEVRNTPFMPWHWGKNQKGMQATEECNELLFMSVEGINFDSIPREEAWLYARDCAADTAETFMDAGYHKQLANRLLEPFSWIDTLITSTDWENFLWLRDHGDAEPHLQDLARLVRQAIDEAEIQPLAYGQWHLPYIDNEDRVEAALRFTDEDNHVDHTKFWGFLQKLSAARCARISYKPFDGDASYKRELERYALLVNSDRVHASPTEHQCSPDRIIKQSTAPVLEPGQLGHQDFTSIETWSNRRLHGNLEGYIQARKLIPNEAHHGGF